MTNLSRTEASDQIKQSALQIGFELVGIAPAVQPSGYSHLLDWLDKGYAGEMGYIERRREAYSDPSFVQQQTRSLVVCAWNYRSQEPVPTEPTEGRVARYAWSGIDYHDYLRDRLQQLAEQIRNTLPEARTRCAVDTAPLLERDFARLAGLGWFGKNTMLINKRKGSWLLLGVVLVDQELAYDKPHETDHCGTCTRCLDVCPTDAFTEPGELDARKCISYLTIELKDSIPTEFRAPMGDWLFGCDLCQDVCPWNNKSPISTNTEVQPRIDLNPISATELFELSESDLKAKLKTSPLLRPGRAGLLRNAAIVLGNSGDPHVVPVLSKALHNEETPVIRTAAAWALGELGGTEARQALQEQCEVEENQEVRSEIEEAIRRLPRPQKDDAIPGSNSTSDL
ncbi:Epoxyqueuosine reductase [Polystyrenella longa]|uniref:Epoxyqueuosine reductase n=1 Tax=Polystyrenella longa TaxID=2528007 RepID=A0A518CPE0_9PLAN|nr:tRNA epoxyqueuosine(34) reductase QueG [Polystyrenella longa]QDU81090.1 Epoxyqueuosine reductase [Polystyrenella longa]